MLPQKPGCWNFFHIQDGRHEKDVNTTVLSDRHIIDNKFTAKNSRKKSNFFIYFLKIKYRMDLIFIASELHKQIWIQIFIWLILLKSKVRFPGPCFPTAKVTATRGSYKRRFHHLRLPTNEKRDYKQKNFIGWNINWPYLPRNFKFVYS